VHLLGYCQDEENNVTLTVSPSEKFESNIELSENFKAFATIPPRPSYIMVNVAKECTNRVIEQLKWAVG
jgi:hypothetical protein